MAFYFAAALLCLVVAAILLAALFAGGGDQTGYEEARTAENGAEADLAIYKDQLRELERDLDRGVVHPAEAEAARIEISRRILAAGRRLDSAKAGEGERAKARTGVIVGSVAAALVSALALYGLAGRPDLEDKAFLDRVDESLTAPPLEELGDAELTALLVDAVRRRPTDPRGWRLLAERLKREGQFAPAANAYGRLLELEGPSADVLASFGETLTLAADGLVTEQARSAFERALEADPTEPTARFYQAIAQGQQGDTEGALEALLALETSLDEGPAWSVAVQEAVGSAMAALRGTLPADEAFAPAEPLPPASPSSQVAADPAVGAVDVNAMVAGLAARLEDAPNDPEGWVRLVRSYVVLGRADEAQAAFRRGVAALADNPAGLAGLMDAGERLGLVGGGQAPTSGED
ncbi:MAG: c-type cytochrome biogenesis protein CcmI [Pseudomonadota bacterium]